MLRRFQQPNASADRFTSGTSAGGRTVAGLLSAAEERAEAELREEAERKARARAAYLDDLATREESTWRWVETPIEMKRPAEYDQAVQLLTDLRDVSARKQTQRTFATRLQELRARHAKKAAFLKRLDRVL